MATIFNPNAAAVVQSAEHSAAQKFADTVQANQQETTANRNNLSGNYKKYKNAIHSCNYIFKDGTQAKFVAGEYLTNNKQRQAELDAEIEAGHPHIYVDANDATVSPEDLDPETAQRKKYFAMFQAEQEAAKNRDMGTSQQLPIKPANSKDMADVTANGAGALSAVPTSLLNALNSQSGSTPTA